MGGQQSIAGLPYHVGELVQCPARNKPYGVEETGGGEFDIPSSALPNAPGVCAQFVEPRWTLRNGTRSSDDAPVSVFVFDTKSCPAGQAQRIRDGVQKLKSTRHPGLLHYEAGTEVEGVIYLVTSRVRPLSQALKTLCQQPDLLAWGLRRIAKVLHFLHTEMNLAHNTLSPSSIYINEAGDWYLSTLDLLHQKAPTKKVLSEYLGLGWFPPEYQTGSGYDTALDGKALDAWLFGCLIYAVHSNQPLEAPRELKQYARQLPQGLLPTYRALLHGSPQQRLPSGELLHARYLAEHPLVQCLEFLEELAVKEDHQKDSFFRRLPEQLDQLPAHICEHKILPLLVQGLDYGAANWRVVTPLLSIGRQLSDESFAKLISPHLSQWFDSGDPQLLLNLLQHMNELAPHLSSKLVNESIMNSLDKAFSARSARLRELGLRACLPIAEKLTFDNRDKRLLRHLAKLQLDPDNGVRANTTICLGKLCDSLAAHTRKRVLVPAFCRALNDQYPPSRIAGLTAFAATLGYYEMEEIARRILPNMCKLTIDPVQDVRDKAFETMHTFLETLKDHARKLSQQEHQKRQASGDSHSLAHPMSGTTPSIVRGKDGKSLCHTPESAPSSTAVASAKLLSWASDMSAVVASKIIGDHPTSPSSSDEGGNTRRKSGTDTSSSSPSPAANQNLATTQDSSFDDVAEEVLWSAKGQAQQQKAASSRGRNHRLQPSSEDTAWESWETPATPTKKQGGKASGGLNSGRRDRLLDKKSSSKGLRLGSRSGVGDGAVVEGKKKNSFSFDEIQDWEESNSKEAFSFATDGLEDEEEAGWEDFGDVNFDEEDEDPQILAPSRQATHPPPAVPLAASDSRSGGLVSDAKASSSKVNTPSLAPKKTRLASQKENVSDTLISTSATPNQKKVEVKKANVFASSTNKGNKKSQAWFEDDGDWMDDGDPWADFDK